MAKKMIHDITKKSDLWLVRAVKTKADSEAFVEICRRAENVFYRVVHKYTKRLETAGIDKNDIFEEKNSILLGCIKSFNPKKKTKLSSWIGNYARYLCLNTLTARKHILPVNDDEIHKSIENSQYNPSDSLLEDLKNDKNFVNNILGQIKDERVSEVIKLRYFSDKKPIWAEVAKKVGCSIQTCLALNARGLKMLRTKLQSKEYMDKI